MDQVKFAGACAIPPPTTLKAERKRLIWVNGQRVVAGERDVRRISGETSFQLAVALSEANP